MIRTALFIALSLVLSAAAGGVGYTLLTGEPDPADGVRDDAGTAEKAGARLDALAVKTRRLLERALEKHQAAEWAEARAVVAPAVADPPVVAAQPVVAAEPPAVEPPAPVVAAEPPAVEPPAPVVSAIADDDDPAKTPPWMRAAPRRPAAPRPAPTYAAAPATGDPLARIPSGDVVAEMDATGGGPSPAYAARTIAPIAAAPVSPRRYRPSASEVRSYNDRMSTLQKRYIELNARLARLGED